jgi:hypothetical protein
MMMTPKTNGYFVSMYFVSETDDQVYGEDFYVLEYAVNPSEALRKALSRHTHIKHELRHFNVICADTPLVSSDYKRI